MNFVDLLEVLIILVARESVSTRVRFAQARQHITIHNVSASYQGANPENKFELALKNLLQMHSRASVALCGRAGSGKSSLVLLLLRPPDPLEQYDSSLHIDDLELTKVARETVHKHILTRGH
jgi:ATP-binding cassette, subfamily C (CFTR/MRP), member 1